MKGNRFLAVLGLAALLFTLGIVLAACADIEVEAPPPPAEEEEEADHAHEEVGMVDVVLDEWSVTEEESGSITLTAHAGEVTFEVNNEGVAPHELVIIRTDLTPDALPVAGGKADEAAAGEEIGKIEEFPGGESKVGTFNLTPGKYALICNIAGHYEQGMFAGLIVEE